MFYNNKQYPIKVVNIANEGLVIKSLGRNDTEPRTLFITNSGNVFRFTFTLIGSKNGYEVLKPILLEIKPASRVKERISGGKLYITNVTNQHDIAKSLVGDNVRINSIMKVYSQKVREKIPYLDLFIHDRYDTRLKLLIDHDKPIFVPNKTDPESVPENFIPYKEYYSLLKNSKQLERYISEISIPLKYKNMVTYGYLSAYNEVPMDISYMTIVETLGSAIKKDIFSHPVLHETKEAIPISDISEGGFSVLQQNSVTFGKIFLLGGTLIFDLCASANEKIVCRAIVRNIRPTEHHFRIGCQFYNEYEEEVKNLEAFIKKHAPDAIKDKSVNPFETTPPKPEEK